MRFSIEINIARQMRKFPFPYRRDVKLPITQPFPALRAGLRAVGPMQDEAIASARQSGGSHPEYIAAGD